MIVKALREGEHHALLLQVRLKDNARAARPGVWPAAAHPADLELQPAVPTTVYHWLKAFHDLRWRGKPDRQIGATDWQAWLQANAQPDAVRSLGPAPATRAPGRALAPHTVPLAHLPLEPATEGAIRKSVPLPPARGATEPTKCSLCPNKYYTSGAMVEHLAWHAVHAADPVDDKEAASNILQGRARRSPWHEPYARRPPPQAADHADGDEEAATAGGEEDMTPTLHPSRHRVDTFLVNEPLPPWLLRESVWARGMAHPQVIGSDHLPVRLALPGLLTAAGRATMPTSYSHTEGRLLPYDAEAAPVQHCL